MSKEQKLIAHPELVSQQKLVFKGELVFLGRSFMVFNESDQFHEGEPEFETLEGALPQKDAQRIADLMHGARVAVSIECLDEG